MKLQVSLVLNDETYLITSIKKIEKQLAHLKTKKHNIISSIKKIEIQLDKLKNNIISKKQFIED